MHYSRERRVVSFKYTPEKMPFLHKETPFFHHLLLGVFYLNIFSACLICFTPWANTFFKTSFNGFNGIKKKRAFETMVIGLL